MCNSLKALSSQIKLNKTVQSLLQGENTASIDESRKKVSERAL